MPCGAETKTSAKPLASSRPAASGTGRLGWRPPSRVYRQRQPFKNLIARSEEDLGSPADAALVLLDLNAFLTLPEEGLGKQSRERGISAELDDYYGQLPSALANAGALAAAFRRKAFHVAHTVLRPRARASSFLSRHGWAVLISEAGARLPHGLDQAGEPVLPKDGLGAFASSDLLSHMKTWQVSSLLLAGVTTSGSVAQTAREAVDHGFQVIVAADGCAGETVEAHLETLSQLSGGPVRIRTVSTLLLWAEGDV